MEHFSVGMISIVFATALPVAYFLGFQLRRLGAWSKRQDGPKERVGFFLLVLAILGFGVGSFAQPLWNKGVECKAGASHWRCAFFHLDSVERMFKSGYESGYKMTMQARTPSIHAAFTPHFLFNV